MTRLTMRVQNEGRLAKEGDKDRGRNLHDFYKELCGKVHASSEEVETLKKHIEKLNREDSEFGFISRFNYFNENQLAESLSLFSKLHNYLIEILG